MQMNSDPRLEFGLETPLLHESDPLDAAHLLASAKDDMCQMLEIENDEEWQVRHILSACSMTVTTGMYHHPHYGNLASILLWLFLSMASVHMTTTTRFRLHPATGQMSHTARICRIRRMPWRVDTIFI